MTELIKQEQGMVWNQKTLETLKSTVAQGATNEEFHMFVEMCKGTGLNPFKRELWFIKANGRVQMMTGINGFYTIANNVPEYDGIEIGLVGPDGAYLPQTYPKQDFIGAWAKVYRKDRKIASEGVAMLGEYDKNYGNWKTMRRVMIAKCAESIALRKAFPQQLNGLYTSEEMPVEYGVTEPVVQSRPEVTVEQVRAQQSVKQENHVHEHAPKPMGEVGYAIPFKSTSIDCGEARNALVKAGFKPDKSEKPWIWYGDTHMPEYDEFLIKRDEGPTFEQDEVVFEGEVEEELEAEAEGFSAQHQASLDAMEGF
jgi:phage recombination protein Bet